MTWLSQWQPWQRSSAWPSPPSWTAGTSAGPPPPDCCHPNQLHRGADNRLDRLHYRQTNTHTAQYSRELITTCISHEIGLQIHDELSS